MNALEDRSGVRRRRWGDKGGNFTKLDGQMRHVKCNLYKTLQHMTKQIGVRTW